VLRVSTQLLEHYRDVAEILRLPHSRVRLEGAYVGGGFGGKEDVTVECLLGLLVWKTRRPVQLVFSREESFIGHGKRHPYVMRYRSGATREGTLTALEAALSMDPLALREKNFLRKGDALATGQVLETDPMLVETMRRAWAGLGERRPSRAPTRVGRAVAASFTPYGRMCWTRDSASA